LKPYLVLAFVATAALPAYAQTGTSTAIADVTRGSQVTVQGVVERIPDEDEFILTDQSGSIEVYLGPTRVPVAVGDTVVVSGFVDDDPGVLDLCASRIERADGTVIQIPNCDG
jgi:uncharacterized protein YdeI (BOF family)